MTVQSEIAHTPSTSTYYRTDDPVENFKIRVIVRQISRPNYFGENDKEAINTAPFSFDETLKWQQKIYGPGNIADYIKFTKNKSFKGSATQIENRRYFSQLESQKGIDHIPQMVKPSMVYTYIDRDLFFHENNACLYPPLNRRKISQPYLSSVVDSMGKANPNLDIGGREKRLGDKLYRENPFKTMHICLAHDVDVESILTAEDGLIEVSPAFSSVLAEPQHATDNDDPWHDSLSGGIALSAFMSDQTTEAAITKGFRLATFRFRTKSGVEFEYANVNDLLIPHKIEDILRKKALQQAIVSAENRGLKSDNIHVPVAPDSTIGSSGLAQVDGNWKQDPSKKDKVVSFYAEIVSGTGFDGELLYVNYQVKMPSKGWELRTGDLNDGHITEAGEEEEEFSRFMAEGMLCGTTHTASVSSFGVSTSLRLPLDRPNWRGTTVALSMGKGTRIMVGASFFIISCLAVLLGAGYPFWIVPGLVILFCVGSGFSSVSPQAVIRNKNKLVVIGEELTENHVSFNHLISFSCDVADVREEAPIMTPSSHLPVLLFQVYSVGWWFGRQRLEGYGYATLNTGSATDVTVGTWRPIGGIRTRMRDLFLSDSVRLKEPSFVEVLNKSLMSLNKFAVMSESTGGKIRFRFQSVETDPRKIPEKPKISEEKKSVRDSSSRVRKTVDEILQSFKSSLSGMRRSSIVGAGASMSVTSSSGDRPGIANILKSIDSTNTTRSNRVSEILARAKSGRSGTGNSKEQDAIHNPMTEAIRGKTPGNPTPQNRYREDDEDADEDMPLLKK